MLLLLAGGLLLHVVERGGDMVVVGRGVVVGGVGLGGGVGRLVNVLVVQRKFTVGLPRRPETKEFF